MTTINTPNISNQPPQTSAGAIVAASLNDGKKHLLLAASGSVATIKLPLIISAFANHTNLSIRIIVTKSATHFLAGQSAEQPTLLSLADLPNVDGIYLDTDEWTIPWTRNAPILHIELRRWAHILAVVPMSANLLARITNGLTDDLLTAVIRAWDTKRGILVAPAMNQLMWEHPLTGKQLGVLGEWRWFEVLQPMVKALACGDVGRGGMMDWREIVGIIEQKLEGIHLNMDLFTGQSAGAGGDGMVQSTS